MSEDTFIGRLDRRLRLMLRHTWLMGIAGILLLVGVAAVTAYVVTRPTTLKIAAGPAGGDDTRVVQAIAQHLARDGAGIRLQIVSKAGSAESAAAVDSGEADLAVVRGDMAPKNGQAVVILRRNHLVLFVPAAGSAAAGSATAGTANAKSKGKGKGKAAKKKTIEKISDLAGTRLGVIGRSQANLTLLNTVLKQYNIPSDKVAVTQISTNELGAALRAGQFDALMAVGPTSSPITAEAVSLASHDKEGPTFLAVDASEAIAQRVPIYESTEIPAGAFGGSPPRPEETVETVGFSHYIVARKGLSEATVGDFAKLVFGVRQSLAVEMPATSKIEAPATDKDATVAVHPGAVAYIDGEQKTFFDKYSELLYWGLFAMSMLGSAAAGLASYAKANDRIDKLRILDRLVELIGVARRATSLDQLDNLQSEVDGILKTTIREVEKGGLDEAALGAFSLALEQTRHAISDRRSLLLAGTASA
jgi:TRAP-type uncharacterized transport system substrate-binding protein